MGGRFISRDPIRFRGGDINLYRAFSNSPINLVDPLGLYSLVHVDFDEQNRNGRVRSTGATSAGKSDYSEFVCTKEECHYKLSGKVKRRISVDWVATSFSGTFKGRRYSCQRTKYDVLLTELHELQYYENMQRIDDQFNSRDHGLYSDLKSCKAARMARIEQHEGEFNKQAYAEMHHLPEFGAPEVVGDGYTQQFNRYLGLGLCSEL